MDPVTRVEAAQRLAAVTRRVQTGLGQLVGGDAAGTAGHMVIEQVVALRWAGQAAAARAVAAVAGCLHLVADSTSSPWVDPKSVYLTVRQ